VLFRSSEYSARWFADFDNGLDLGVVAYRTDFARDWFKLDRINPAGSAVGSGSSGASISSILNDPIANAAAFEVITGAPGFVSADGAVLIKHNNREYFAQGVQLVAGYEANFAGAAHDFEIGVRFHRDEEDRFQWRERFRMDNGTLVRTGVDPRGSEANRVSEAEALAIYVQDQIEIGDWTFTPGVRLEDISLTRTDYAGSDPDRTTPTRVRENDIDVVIPGLGVLWDASDDLALFAGVHKGFAPPAPGQTNTDAEEAVNWEVGARWAGDRVQIEAAAFFNDYSNFIGTCTASTGGGCTIGDQFDGGEVQTKGIEFSATTDLADIFNAPVSLPASLVYSYTDAEFQNAFSSAFGPWSNVVAGDKVPYIPAHQITARLGIEGDTWGAETLISYVDETRSSAGQGAIAASNRIEDRIVVDLSGHFDVTENVALTVSVQNVFDETYAVSRRPAGLRPGLPRTALVGVRLNF